MGNAAFRVLGPVEVIRDDTAVSLGRGTLTDLLATLMVSPGQAVSADTLIETVWHTRRPVHSRATLHSAVARLRKIIGGDFIETLPSGYRFRAGADSLDLLNFERLREAASLSRDTPGALSALTEAVGLWRGAPLENVASPVLLNDAVPHLTQLYLQACEEWAALSLQAGQHDAVVGRLAALVHGHPFRERMTGQLMLALYGVGRQADAIDVYETARRALGGEMGIDPGPALQELHLKILRADPSLHGLPSQASRTEPDAGQLAAQPRAPAVVPRQLPRDLPDFCGRQEELVELTARLTGRNLAPGETAVAVICGKGGIGKTALAIQAGHRLSASFPDGQLLAKLHSGGRLVPVARVAASFLRALGVADAAIPQSLADRVTMFRSLTAGRRLLIVLDNAASESQVRPLLPAGASCAVIVTSRARLAGLPGARLVNLDVLDGQHAMDLLAAIIGAGRVAHEHADARLLASLCGGLPLALRIVGMRLVAKAHWPLATLAGRLANERRLLSELSHGDLDVRATFDVSYEALDELAKTMLRRLSLLEAPDFPAWAGAALLDTGPDEAADICERLVDAQLLDPATRRRSGEIRYQFHDLVRAFARELAGQTEPDAERERALDRAFGAWLALAGQAHRHVYGGDYTILHGSAARWTKADGAQQAAIKRNPVDWLEGERVAILAAIRQSAETGRHEVAWDLAWIAVTLWEARGYYNDWNEAVEHALAAARSAGDARGTAAMLTCLASLRLQDGTADPGLSDVIKEALRLFAMAGDTYGCALARCRLGVAYTRTGNTGAAIPEYEQGLQEAREAGDLFMEACVLRELGRAHIRRGHPLAAASCLAESLRLHKHTGSIRGQALTLYTLGELLLGQGDPHAAQHAFRQALAMIKPNNDLIGQAYSSLRLGEALASAGDPAQAEELLHTALRLGRQIRNPSIEHRAVEALSRITAQQPTAHGRATE